jgi:putative PIN family toxin of toxin-antitoxin system
VTSQEIIDEWREVGSKTSVLAYLQRRRADPADLAQLIESLIECSRIIEPPGEPTYCRDEKDRKYLHCALDGRVELLVTTDLDLLEVREVGSSLIVRPRDAWDIVRAP